MIIECRWIDSPCVATARAMRRQLSPSKLIGFQWQEETTASNAFVNRENRRKDVFAEMCAPLRQDDCADSPVGVILFSAPTSSRRACYWEPKLRVTQGRRAKERAQIALDCNVSTDSGAYAEQAAMPREV